MPDQPEAPELVALRELFLVPGRTLSYADIPAATMAKLNEVGLAGVERAKRDWANLCKFAAKNRRLLAGGSQAKVVFMGDSITENWEPADPAFFGPDQVDRGIGGQTTSQMLLRMYPDVVALNPRVVHIMAGTNDVAGNLGPVSDDTIVDNIAGMIDIARANGIKVVLGSIPPTKSFFWNPSARPAQRVRDLNARLHALANARKAIWVDYHSRLTDGEGGLPAALSNDGVHPNRAGYAAMRPAAELAIRKALR